MGQILHENDFTISFFLNTYPSKAKNKISTNHTLFSYSMIKVVVRGGKTGERGRMGKKIMRVRAVYFLNFLFYFLKDHCNICWKVKVGIF